MRVFVTGASGFIGSAVVPELLGAGHEVVGLARSDASAAAIAAAGAEVHRGSLDELDSLRAGATDADGVIHLAFIHDFSQYAASADVDRSAIEALGEELAGSDRPLVVTSGLLGLASGRLATERDTPAPGSPRFSEAAGLAFAERGVRASVVRLAPTVHGENDHGFVAALVGIARDKGVSGYVGDGCNRWPAVHRLDAARLFRLAVESAPSGSVLHGADEEGVATRDIAAAIGAGLDVPVESREPEHFDWLGPFWGADVPASSAHTRELLGWAPTQPGLLADLEAGRYF